MNLWRLWSCTKIIIINLKDFTCEWFTGCNKIKCDKCSVNDNRNLSDACVWYRITSSPSVLVLHIKRFAQFGLRLKKLNSTVQIQPMLDLAHFCSVDCPTEAKSKDKNRILYRLYGVVEHVGSLHSGHYTAYVCQRGSQSDNRQPPRSEATDIIASLLDKLNEDADGDSRSLNDSLVSESSNTQPSSKDSLLNNTWYHISDSTVRQVPLSKVLTSSPYMLFYEKMVSLS